MLKWIKHIIKRVKKTKLKVVYDEDLMSLLKSLEIKEKIEKGDYHCISCKTLITIENIGKIIKIKNEIKLTCSKPECLCYQ